jgi:hypothetical protein
MIFAGGVPLRRLETSLRQRVGLFDWQLHEHQPAERRHRGVSDEQVAAKDVRDPLHPFAAGSCARPERRPYLTKLRHIRIAENEADVRKDQAVLRVEYIRLPVLADFALRNHVLDLLEIDLNDADADVAASRRVLVNDSVI